MILVMIGKTLKGVSVVIPNEGDEVRALRDLNPPRV